MNPVPGGSPATEPVEPKIYQPYRPDIDGLRALAIISVVIFHAFPRSLKGGFVGVDVFFVISGYLISGIIFRSLQRGEFNFTEFYAHRIKRIFPALSFVLLACYTFGWFSLFSDEFKQLGKHIAAGAGFLQNFVLWQEAGYFDSASELKPLMHLWSLAIEEQFYLGFPLVIWMAWRIEINIRVLLLLLLSVSFGLNAYGVTHDTTKTFFVPQTRFWELLVGAFLAHYQTVRPTSSNSPLTRAIGNGFNNYLTFPSTARRDRLLNIASIVGLLLIVLSDLGLSRNKLFPGWWALLPVLGAALLILSGPGAWVNRKILSSRVMVLVGLISYPLYLWHWPLLAFARTIESEFPSVQIRFSMVLLAFALAWLTYQFVEKPFRFGARIPARSLLLTSSMVVIGTIGFVTYKLDGVPSREIEQEFGAMQPDSSHLKFHGYISENFPLCDPPELHKRVMQFADHTRCAQTDVSPVKSFAIVGDSHAENLFIGLAEKMRGKENVIYLLNDCLPFVGLIGVLGCDEMSKLIRHITSDPNVKTILLSGNWLGRWDNRRIRLSADVKIADKKRIFESALTSTLLELTDAGKEVYLMIDIPTFEQGPAKCVPTRPFGSKSPRVCTIRKSDHLDNTEQYLAVMRSVLKQFPSVRLIDPTDYLCDSENCSMKIEGVLLYRDTNHLSVDGSKFLGPRLIEQFGSGRSGTNRAVTNTN
jgi:peptidoglycan/LPS O-acetylase OafA/YrhL